jgi:hypothetical protein
MKFSKDLLELRDKEAKLVKMKRYEEAEKVKMKADLLEEFERNKLEAEVPLIFITDFSSLDASSNREERSEIEALIIVSFGSSFKENTEG